MKAVAYYEAYENMDIEEEDEEKIKENEKIVLESKNSYWAFEFAYDFPKSNIKALENIIIEDKNVFFAFKFAHCIEGANKEELFKVVLESGDKYYINIFLQFIEFDKDKFANYLLFI